MIQVHVFIFGKVQGVGFRAAIKKLADELHIAGFVKNLTYEDIEAIFQGDEESVKKMIEFCRTGPPGAQVNDVQDNELKLGKFDGFKIEK
ncbi:MAG: acylphosphatase [Nanoarchaeota archaeon]